VHFRTLFYADLEINVQKLVAFLLILQLQKKLRASLDLHVQTNHVNFFHDVKGAETEQKILSDSLPKTPPQ